MRKTKFVLGITIFFVISFFAFTFVKAEIDCQNANPSGFSAGDAQFCADQLTKLINQYLPAQQTNKKNLANLQSQLNDINRRITALSNQIKVLTANINQREEDLAYARAILDEKAVKQYKNSRLYSPILALISATDATEAFRIIKLMGLVAEEDRKIIEKYAKDLLQLKKDEDSLQKSKDALSVAQKQVADRTNFLAAEVAKVESYLSTLSAKQAAFIAAKLESLGLSRSAYNMKGGCSSDINPFKSPGFSPAYAFFTYGVPNRVGLNQFGAKGRAEQNQTYEQILRAYYNADITSGYGAGITIHVVGQNEPQLGSQNFDDYWNIEEYLKHIYEMPADWPAEALRAQAIAARSYAMAYTNNGSGSICPSQKCQVVKREFNDQRWIDAVTATSGIVLTNGGSPVKAWFSSTHGGYAFNSGDIGWSSTAWTKRIVDTTSGGAGSFSDLFNNAYDKNSPIFYCDWGARASYNKTAWLKPDELADIVNAALLARGDGSTKSHLYQSDIPNPEGTDTWDVGRVKNELSARGGTPIDSVTDISVGVDFGTGRTTSINVNGQTINGDDFKSYFNLRAPANIQIVGPLYNVEKR